MKIEWTSKIGNEAKPFRVSLTTDGTPVAFASLTGPGGSGVPQLRLRLRENAAAAVLSFDLSAYADPDGVYNAQRFFTDADFAAITPGIYVAEIDAELSGRDVTFPDDRHALIRFLPSVN